MATAMWQSASYLPHDVLMNILIKLPARSLSLFKFVSKQWFVLIQSPTFINLHLNLPVNNNPVLIVRHIYAKPRGSFLVKPILSFLISDNDDETLAYKHEMSLDSLSPWFQSRNLWTGQGKGRVLGPCNGLLCLTDTVDIVLFNPTTKQRRDVIRLPSIPPGNSTWYHYGIFVPCFDRVCFGYDIASLDYKVVGFRLISQQGSSYRVDIYSLTTNTWSQINRVAPACSFPWLRGRNHGFFFNCSFHWFGSRCNDICSIVVFDINKEAFKEFKLPSSFPVYGYRQLFLSALDDEYLTMFVAPGESDQDNEIEIWVMKEYGVYNSWTKLYNISVGMVIKNPLSFSNDGGEFFFEDVDMRLTSLNLKTREIKRLEVANPEGNLMFAFRYREILV